MLVDHIDDRTVVKWSNKTNYGRINKNDFAFILKASAMLTLLIEADCGIWSGQRSKGRASCLGLSPCSQSLRPSPHFGRYPDHLRRHPRARHHWRWHRPRRRGSAQALRQDRLHRRPPQQEAAVFMIGGLEKHGGRLGVSRQDGTQCRLPHGQVHDAAYDNAPVRPTTGEHRGFQNQRISKQRNYNDVLRWTTAKPYFMD